MNILHICNDFAYSKVHMNLYKEFDKKGDTQFVFHPLRYKESIGKNNIDFLNEKSEIFYSDQLNKLHTIFFELKIKFLYKQLKKYIDNKDIDISIATTLFSDGYLAYKLFKDHNIPYTVAIRSTDVDVFFKYRPDLLPLALKILNNAKKVIFISSTIKNTFFKNTFLNKRLDKSFNDKTVIINNGIDDYWIDNKKNIINKNSNKLLYIGSFEKRKNLKKLITALTRLREDQYSDIELHIVGGYKDVNNEIHNLIHNLDWIRFYGEIQDKKELISIIESSDCFVMPSYRETFGLVYLEALSQGLPILYSKGEGIDGVLDIEVGNSVDPHNIDNISDGLEELIKNFLIYKNNINDIQFESFRWSNIASVYHSFIK